MELAKITFVNERFVEVTVRISLPENNDRGSITFGFERDDQMTIEEVKTKAFNFLSSVGQFLVSDSVAEDHQG